MLCEGHSGRILSNVTNELTVIVKSVSDCGVEA